MPAILADQWYALADQPCLSI